MIEKIKKELRACGNPEKVKILSNFFKTGPGQYGEGDKFWGVTVPEQRKIAKKYDLGYADLQVLIKDPVHECRLTGLLMLVHKYQKADERGKEHAYKFYLKNSTNINNWDLVDVTAPKVVGAYLLDKKRERKILDKLAGSKNLWEKRIAIVSTYEFIRHNQFEDTIRISEKLLKDDHDLIHKAVGWMLREVGKRDEKLLTSFLDTHWKAMPRTMVRYAIEKFPEVKRKKYFRR